MRVVVVFAVLAVLATPALADGDPPEPVDEHVALALSLGGTVASWGLVVASVKLDGEMSHDAVGALTTIGLLGTFLAPSAGHWYADKYLTRGLGLRALGGASATLGVITIAGCIGEDADCSGALGAGLLLLGAGLYAYGTVDDIASAPARARARNAEIEALTVAPLVTPTTTGLAIAGSF